MNQYDLRQNSKISIDCDGSKFIIKCPFHANDLVVDMPVRRWSKSQRVWISPITRKNAEYIRDNLHMLAVLTDAAKDAVTNAIDTINKAKPSRFPAWYRFKTEPMPHQMACLNKFYGLNVGAMFMDRGTGKTKTSIDLCCAMRMEGRIDAVLVLCKLTLRRNWRNEWEQHAPIPHSIYLPFVGKRREFTRWMNDDIDFPVMVVGLESLSTGDMHKFCDSFIESKGKCMTVIDESHYIANHKAVRTQRCMALGQKSKARLALTGTPISVGPMNLFSQFEFLDPDILGFGDFLAFRNRYAVMGGYRNPSGKPMQIVGYQNMDELIKAVEPFTFQVFKDDVLNLPPKRFKRHYVDLTPAQVSLYKTIKKSGIYGMADDQMTVKNVLELMLRLHQVCGGFSITKHEERRWSAKEKEYLIREVSSPTQVVDIGNNPKINEVLSIIEDAPDDKYLIWCAYRPEMSAVHEAIHRKFPKLGASQLHGDLDEDEREEIKRKFQGIGIQVLISNPGIGGTGHNLTAANTVIYFSNTFSLVNREQSEDRAHRKGLEHSVLYIDVIASGTIDEVIMDSLTEKKELSDYIRSRLGELDLFGTGQEA